MKGVLSITCSLAGLVLIEGFHLSRLPFFQQKNKPMHSTVSNSEALAGFSGSWDREGWIRGFETARTEECYEIVEAMGGIPKDLVIVVRCNFIECLYVHKSTVSCLIYAGRFLLCLLKAQTFEIISSRRPNNVLQPQEGTLFRNGHAKFDVNGVKIAHPFDGDGMISAVTFKDGRAFFRNRFVWTKGYQRELKSGKIEYRGTFGTQKEGGWLANIFDLRRKNVANTNVIYWGGRLLALWEGGLPHLMDPVTLQTYGESRIAKVLKPGQNLAAHPRYDPVTNRYVFFSTDPDPRKTKVTVYEFDDQFKYVLCLIVSSIHSGFCAS